MAVASAKRDYRFGDELRREWRLILASLLGISCAISTIGHPYSIGIMMGPLQREFGWSTLDVQGVQPYVAASVVLMSASVGWWIDHHRVRPVVLLSHLGYGLCMAAIGLLTSSLVSFYALLTLAGLLGGGMLAVSYMKLLVPRFERERGLAMGLALTGSGVSSFVYQRVLVRIVDAYGWRAGYVAIGLLALLVSLPVALLWVRDREANNATRAGSRGAALVSGPAEIGASFAAAAKSYRLWTLILVFVLFSGSVTCVLNNFTPILVDKGYSRVNAVAIASWFGLALIVGRVGIGALIDRVWAPAVGCGLFLASASGMYLLSLPGFGESAHLTFVILAGLAAGAEVDLMSYLASRYFGTKAFGKIYGAIYVGFAMGPGLLVPWFAATRDRTGGFAQGLVFVALAMAVAGILLILLGRYPAAYSPQPTEVAR